MSSSDPKWHSGSDTEGMGMVVIEEALRNGSCDVETVIDSHSVSSSGGDVLALSNDGVSEISNSDLSLPEVCISTNSTSFEEDMNYEVQQAYRIFNGFLLDKHKAITGSFLNPIGHLEAQHGIGGVRGRGQDQLKQSMCLRRMEEKFVGREYETITEFVADFRLMLENCYRYHGVDHWISKQAQKLEIMLEQKLTLLSRTLREKTTLAITSKGRFGAEEERGSGGTSTRRRSAPRSLATLTVGGHESIMVQTLRLEEQQRAKEEKRQRELEKKEAEEMSAKEVEEWEKNLLSQASPHSLETLWELPAIGHLLCLAQTALNLPEIVFFELERCLLMPRCSPFLNKIMSALLCPPQRRATLHRRPSLPYRRWESELRQRVQGWYRTVGASHDQPARAEQLGLCHQFFSTLGEVSPLEETPFHLLPFYQRVWLLKGLCDNVYETQKDVQDAVLGQPIHECRESILGYDSKDSAYIHFPHFCGADLRIYCQSPSTPPRFPLPSVWVKRIEPELGTAGEGSDGMKPKKLKGQCYGTSTEIGESDDSGNEGKEKHMDFQRENGGTKFNSERFNLWPLKDKERSDTETSDEDESSEDSKSHFKMHNNSFFPTHLENPNRGKCLQLNFKEESQGSEHQPSTLTVKQVQSFSLDSGRTIKAEILEPCLNVGEHSYTGRSPARSDNLASPSKGTGVKMGGDIPNHGHRVSSCLKCSKHNNTLKSEEHVCCCSTSNVAQRLSCESARNSSEERVNDRMRSRKKRRKKGRGHLLRVKGRNRQLQQADGVRECQAQDAKSSMQISASATKRKGERKKNKTGKKINSTKKVKEESPIEPSFKLVCTSLDELRELINKTEDELDTLESSKKRVDRWFFYKESVKELHITLIRLLNELSPWEPKLVKAYQRNRLRMKKDFDDFRKHSDYNNFVREECLSSSSDEDEDDSEGRESCSLPDHYRGAEEDDHGVPRSLWTGGALKQLEDQSKDSLMTTITANHLKYPFSTDEDVTLQQRNHTNMTFSPHSAMEPRSRLNITDKASEGCSTLATASATQASLGSRSIILHPTIGLPKGYTPIPTLLAKSVGNKVTLMKRPADWVSSNVGQSKVQVMTRPSLMVDASKRTQAQSSQSQPEQSFQELPSQGLQKTQGCKRIVATATNPLPKSPQAKPPHATLPKSPVQLVCKVPEGLGHLLKKKDDNSQVKISVQSIIDQNTGEKRMQQVVILPSNLLIQKTDEKLPSQQLHKTTQPPFSKVTSPLCMTTNLPGFTIPDGRIPVQQVAPLKDARAVKKPSPSVSPHLQQNPLNTSSLKVSQASSTQANTPQTIVQNCPLATSPTSAVSTESTRPTDPKQELKTVCIRDSQSILVTTRGGNTGIVKVQTSSDQNAPGSLPPSPVITISPQFKAFLVSQTSPRSLSAPSQTSTCTFPAGMKPSEVQPQQQAHSVKRSSTVTGPWPAPVTSRSCVGIKNQTSCSSVGSTGPTVVSQSGQKAETTTTASQLQAKLVNTVIVPSPIDSGTNPLTTTTTQSKLGVKCVNTDERSQLTKLILVAPPSSSSSAPNTAVHKDTSSSTASLSSSRFVFISQSAGATTTSTTSMGCFASLGLVAGAGGQPLATSLPNEPVKMGISLGQPLNINHSDVQSITGTLPTGVQIRLPGRTVSLGQAGGALPQSPNSTSGSISTIGSQTATTGMSLVQSSKMVTSNLDQVTSTSTSSHVQASTTVPGTSPPRSTADVVTPPPSCVVKKDPSVSKGVFATNPSVQVTTTGQINPAKTAVPTPVHQSTNVLSVPTSSIVPTMPASPLKCGSITGSTNPFSTSPILSAGTMQQRIVINTTTPLAAGTQILLNNTRFVVPPQGLGPGSHVLLITSPVTPPVPITSTTTTTPVNALLQSSSPMTDTPRRPVIPASTPARLPNKPAQGSSVVVGAPAMGSALLITTPTVTPLRLAGMPTLSSPSSGATNVVSTLPRLAAPHRLASPVSGTPTLVSALPLLASTSSALISPVLTSAPTPTPVLPAVQLPAGTSTLAQCSPHKSTLSPALAVLPRLTAPPLISPNLPTTSAVALISPGTSTLATLSSAELAGLPPSTQQRVSVGTLPASSTATNMMQASLHTGPTHTSIKHQVATVMQPILATRTQLLSTVAAPTISSTSSKMQSLPIATVTPIGSTLNSLQASPVAIVPPSNTTVLMTPAQPNRELKTTHQTISTTTFLTNNALGKSSLQNFASAVHSSIGSKLLISPDGAVLNTVQGPVNTASLPVISPKPLASLVVSCSSSSSKTLPTTCTNNSTVQAAEGDIHEPMN